MQKKYFNFQPKGMNTNMSFKFQSNEYATYMKNIRLTEDNNGVLSLQFEKGNKILNTGISGCVIGTCVLNKYLVLFTQKTEAHRRPDGSIVSYNIDSIYRLEIVDNELITAQLFEGSLNFDTKYPIETLGVYENENIQKVYFIDGKNQARVINILEDYTAKYEDIIEYKATAFDFVPELQLNESISIKKIIGTGEFPQGTIQYVFSYYNKNGRQSNLFTQSDLQYLAYNKGVSPEEKVNCSFKIYIDNVDRQFDYLRIYSIIRTSQDATPTVKRVVDLSISDTNKNKTSLSKVSTLNTGSNLDDFGKTMEVTNIAKFEQIDNYNNGLYVQGAVCYGKYLFQAYIGGKFIDIIDLETNQKQALLTINIDVNTRAYHGNVLSFGKDIAPGSNFPYLYYSCENNSNPQILVIKITSSNADSNQWTGELVQTIYLPESNGGNSQNGSTDISTTFKHYYQNGCIDAENNCIWVSGYTMESFNSNIGAYDNNKLIYRKYELPSVSEKKVYFSYNNVLDSFILPFKKGTQGMVIRNNKLYQCFGYDKGDVYDEFLDCINLSTKQIFHSYQFPKTQLAGLGEELESPYIYKNNLYLSATVNSWRYYTLWSISFNGGGDIIVPPEPPIPEEKADISFIDNGSIGDIIDPTELLYLGGNTICPNTFEQKDSTLFIGNYTINNNDISEETAIKIRNLLGNKLGFKYRATSISYKGKNDYYNYEGQLGESDVAGFKYMEWYGVAIQFQNKNGRFSSPIYLGSTRNYFPPSIVDYNLSEEVGVNRGELNLDIDITELVKIIDTNIWVKARLLIVNPTNSLKTVLCQGIISSTVFNYRDRYNNAPFTMSSWRMNSLGKHLNSLFANSISWGEIQNIEFSKSPIIIGESSTTKINIKCTIYLGYYRTIVISEDNRVLYDKTSPTTIKAKENLKKWNSNIDITKISDDSWKNKATILQEIKINDVDTIVNDFGECFAYDESLVTFNSPDIENQYNNINKNAKLRIIGILKSNPLFSNYLIQGSDLNDPSKGNVPTKNIKNFTSALLWRDMDSSWDNLGDYDANKDWLFATYLWHRETSYSDNGIEKKNSDGNSRKVWSKPVKKIISNTRECTTSYLRDSLSYIDDIEEINKFNYYELPIDDIKVITTNNDAIYKLNSNMGNSYTETLSYTSDTNKLFPTNNEYPIYGQQYYAYNEDSISDYITYNTIIVDGKAVTSKDPVRIKYRETPHAIISFGSKNNSTVKLPRMSINHKSEIDRVGEDAVTRRLFWNTKNNSYTKDFIWTKYINEYTNYMNPTDIGNNYFFYNANPSINDYYYLADLCVQDPDTSPYELSNGNKDIISQYSFIPAGEAINLTGETISLRGNHGDTYYQRWDCLKTFPYSTDDKNQYIDITSFFVESRINLDGRYDKQRGLKYNLGVLNTNFNLINKSYTQRNNFFNYRQIEDEGVNNFPNQITISKTKVLGEDVDSWTNITLASVFDLDGDKGKLNAIRKINNDLYCFQDSGVSRLLYNSRVQVNTSDGVPIEIANSAKLQDKQYLSDSIGCQNKWAIKSTPQGIYFVDTYNGELYRINDKGITPISQNKFKNYFTKLRPNVWSPSLWNYNNAEDFVDSIKLEYDSTTSDLYIINKDTALAYNELLGEFTSFYDYGSVLYWINLEDKSLQIYNDGMYEAYKGDYGTFKGKRNSPAVIEFIANGDFDSDKVFETIELTTSDIAKINNWKADCYPFDTLEVSNEYQRGKNEASSTNVKKKFRTWRWQIPRNNKKNEDGIITNRDRIRNMWAKIRLSKNYNSPLSIYDINVAYYS
ncbi:MAG: stabilization protein [Bacteriophage sp.]|nr:MAG: stabilization protein [Bacteriophage sp.]